MAPRHTTLILCRDRQHCRDAFAALGIHARYECWDSPMTGSRFEKVIWLAGTGEKGGGFERAAMVLVQETILPTKLKLNGELYIL